MENLNAEHQHDNSKLIYEYAEKTIEKLNKTKENIGVKLSSSLGFSGVLLKFVGDMNGHGYLFSFKTCITLLLLAAIGFCGRGLYPLSTGRDVETWYMRKEWYYFPEEEFRRQIIDHRLNVIKELGDLAESRQTYLNYAITCLMLAATTFGVSIIVEAIPK